MKRVVLIAFAALALAGCEKKAEVNPVNPDTPTDPQIVDIAGLPEDRSAEITAIDASTGDASGMPRDGGKAIELPKQEAAPAPEEVTVNSVEAPLVVPPPIATPAPAVPPPAAEGE
ncbi:hypothetical protein [Sphingomonas montanisoli]|uniref:Uncharacterized protein n=1 Tax=Sphingomonas montanisoli TaxID=2606412 RepID=A0A5D9CD41_9SPHN|nr:hypothetical protein [Sphingomonas montanisoli]TZG29266.1 hypothetical protein FYJ91_03800 [Sphingomonas montanisoli]